LNQTYGHTHAARTSAQNPRLAQGCPASKPSKTAFRLGAARPRSTVRGPGAYSSLIPKTEEPC